MKQIKIIAALLSMLFSINLYSQNTSRLSDVEKDKGGNVMFAKISPAQQSNQVMDIALLLEVLNCPAPVSFKLADSVADNLGYIHKAYQQYYKGIKVVGGDYVLHSKDGIARFINGNYISIKNEISFTPAFSTKEAEIFARNKVMQKNGSAEISLQLTTQFKEMAIVEDQSTLQRRLAFKIFVNAADAILAENEFIDAISGKLLLTENLICSFLPPNAVGFAETTYSSTQTITTDAISSNQFRMREIRNGVNIITRNANHTTNPLSIPGTATDIFDNNNNWQAFEHSTDRISYDAHWGAEKVFDYWLTVHNRNSINGSGIAINSYFHFRTNEENAYWFTDTKSMYYGDGGSIFKPLAALDVCAHEFGHGITEFTVPNGGLNKTGEAGALNEGFSDIWGASVEAWAAPNKQRWLIGEEIMLNGVHCLRNIQNPKDLTAREHDPDTYHGTNWDYANEPHQNSTVLSHWYYLISVGGTGTNDIGSIYNVSAIGIDHASKIAYRTEQLLNPSANYAMARTMSIQAAKELYGVGSCEEISVTNAWYAVGIGGQFVNSASISGDNIVCTTSGNYLVNSLPAGATVSWQASPSGVVTINSPNATQTTLTKNNNGVITLTAIITLSCGAQFTVSKQQIVIGPQTSTNIVGLNPPLGVSPGELLELSVMEDGSSYLWEVEGGVISGLSNQQSVTIQVNQCPPNVSNGYINVHVTINNACGTGGIYTESTTVDCGTGGGPFRLMPNPANSIIAVDGELKNKFIKEIKIMDKLGNIKRQVRFSGNDKRITIDVSLLSPDIYYLQVFDGKIWETMQLLIKR